VRNVLSNDVQVRLLGDEVAIVACTVHEELNEDGVGFRAAVIHFGDETPVMSRSELSA